MNRTVSAGEHLVRGSCPQPVGRSAAELLASQRMSAA